jgi:hypothetical protein
VFHRRDLRDNAETIPTRVTGLASLPPVAVLLSDKKLAAREPSATNYHQLSFGKKQAL